MSQFHGMPKFLYVQEQVIHWPICQGHPCPSTGWVNHDWVSMSEPNGKYPHWKIGHLQGFKMGNLILSLADVRLNTRGHLQRQYLALVQSNWYTSTNVNLFTVLSLRLTALDLASAEHLLASHKFNNEDTLHKYFSIYYKQGHSCQPSVGHSGQC